MKLLQRQDFSKFEYYVSGEITRGKIPGLLNPRSPVQVNEQ